MAVVNVPEPTIAVRTAELVSPADWIVITSVQKHAKDLTFRLLRRGDDATGCDATLLVGVRPVESDPAPVTVVGAGTEIVTRGTLCSDGPRNISSSAGYAEGVQFVGNFMAPVGRARPRTGVLDVTERWSRDPSTDFRTLEQELSSAESVVTRAASPIVTWALSQGAVVRVTPTEDVSWPVHPTHFTGADVEHDGADLVLVPRERDRTETGAAPRVARLLRQAAYLGF